MKHLIIQTIIILNANIIIIMSNSSGSSPKAGSWSFPLSPAWGAPETGPVSFLPSSFSVQMCSGQGDSGLWPSLLLSSDKLRQGPWELWGWGLGLPRSPG